MHAGQVRRSGEPYISHPLEVAYLTTQLRLDAASVATALLHDIVEDTAKDEKEQKLRLEAIEANFGKDVAFLVLSLTKLKDVQYSSKEDRNAESFRKLLISMSKDIRVLVIKLADRLHNMRTLGAMSREAQERIGEETLRIYAPLANVLGINWLKNELEDLSFKYLWTEDYENILSKVDAMSVTHQKHIERIRGELSEYVSRSGIKSEVFGRSKHLYSIYRKMKRQNIDFAQVYDLAAFRIIVDTVGECYAVLGLIHGRWKYIPERWKDYISQPKGNGYRSIHTTVITEDGEQIEIQIRTAEMHKHAENGVASHWRYKEGKSLAPDMDKILQRLRDMAEWQSEITDSTEFISITGEDLEAFSDSVYVITPRGKVIDLPKGATPIDFAYYIHTEVGHQCAGAIVNGQQVPLSTELKNGDKVEIVTRKDHKPSRDWLKIVATGRARSKIQSYIRASETSGYIELGRTLLEKQLRKSSLSSSQLQKSGILGETAKSYKTESVEELYREIGIGRLDAKAVVEKIEEHEGVSKPSLLKKVSAETLSETLSTLKSKVGQKKKSPTAVSVEGLGNILVKFARCCSPVPGDNIIGYIVRGEGVIIHRRNCHHISDYDPERKVEVTWDGYTGQEHEVPLKITVDNRVGMLHSLSGVIARYGINIVDIGASKGVNGKVQLNFLLNIKNSEQLRQLVSSLKQISGVLEVQRGET
ncbi:MAG: bifunctional (p)ppGpp synthetase/guanosine-3',5'-bis(diphosphate) 3'-pyrophosphohydrolase [Myxococcota bacterium]